MLHTTALAIALLLVSGPAAFAQFPAQPAPPSGAFPLPLPIPLPNTQGTPEERAACHPDVVKYCQAELKLNENDTMGILNCLQRNRPRISQSCDGVLRTHGQ